MNNPKHVVIISLDAIGEDDIKYLRTLPNFKEYYKGAAYSDKVLSVYPTLTYPCHTSISTGLYPKHHGVINNVHIQPKRNKPDWIWHRKYIRGATLYEEVKKRGGSVGAFLWPVTAGAKSIDYHIPEIFSNRWWDNQLFTSLRNGSKIFQLKMFMKYLKLLAGIKQPNLDNFCFACAMDTILKYKPTLTLIHLTDVDTQKHYGFFKDVKRALQLFDERLGEIIATLKLAGIYENTTLILLGDHSQIDCNYIVYPNTFFKEKGWLKYNVNKKIIKSYKVLARDCDGSCYIYIDKKYKNKLHNTVKRFLDKIVESNKYGVEKVYTKEEAIKKGADPRCDFMLEAKAGYYFQNEADVRIYKIDKEKDGPNGIMRATHGFDPNKNNYHTIFAMRGVGVRPGEYGEMCLVDEAPTIARLMGFEMRNVDGKAIEEFLENGN